jgi:hypothetical protein
LRQFWELIIGEVEARNEVFERQKGAYIGQNEPI